MDGDVAKTLPLENYSENRSPEMRETVSISSGHDSPPARIVMLSGWEDGREIALLNEEYLLGRGATTDIQINAPSVSREHAVIRRGSDVIGFYFTITDLGSSNGTRVNGTYTTEARLKSGDCVQLGDVMLKFYEQEGHSASGNS